jgi:HAMP domain-containing protein
VLAVAGIVAIVLLQNLMGKMALTQDWPTHAMLAARFKWLVLGLSVSFLVVINASALVLLRAAGMILQPMDRLVVASRELAAEHFDHRIPLDRKDEFGELAQAYNQLAAQLQANESKRLETLSMVARTLNHELNNAMGIIELQLQLMARSANQREPLEKFFQCIGESLNRMSQTVESLKHVKRIVLTDYLGGTKMLDLQKSTQSDESETSDRRTRTA